MYDGRDGKKAGAMEREVKWVEECIREMEDTFEFYDYRNGTSQYSQSLYSQIIVSVNRVSINPLIGHLTEYPHVRYIVVVPNYSVFYHFGDTSITVLVLWDNRRNPARLTYILRNTSPMYLCEDMAPYGKDK